MLSGPNVGTPFALSQSPPHTQYASTSGSTSVSVSASESHSLSPSPSPHRGNRRRAGSELLPEFDTGSVFRSTPSDPNLSLSNPLILGPPVAGTYAPPSSSSMRQHSPLVSPPSDYMGGRALNPLLPSSFNSSMAPFVMPTPTDGGSRSPSPHLSPQSRRLINNTNSTGGLILPPSPN